MVKRTLYFGFGSNLWRKQMSVRCPTSHYLGLARLNDYRWIINDRGYANVVELSDDEKKQKREGKKHRGEYEDEVWGLVYSLTAEDERRLDVNEGVPECYGKEILEVDFWSAGEDDRGQEPSVLGGKEGGDIEISTRKPSEKKDMLVYVDRARTLPAEPKKEYIFRMNMGIRDALKEGVPKEYVQKVMRRFIPDVEDRAVEEFARKQALKFEDVN